MSKITNEVKIAVITELLKEAKKNHKRAKKEFEKYDNHDDMHDMENWENVVRWLSKKMEVLNG